jgi:hypothetical protein
MRGNTALVVVGVFVAVALVFAWNSYAQAGTGVAVKPVPKPPDDRTGKVIDLGLKIFDRWNSSRAKDEWGVEGKDWRWSVPGEAVTTGASILGGAVADQQALA